MNPKTVYSLGQCMRCGKDSLVSPSSLCDKCSLRALLIQVVIDHRNLEAIRERHVLSILEAAERSRDHKRNDREALTC